MEASALSVSARELRARLAPRLGLELRHVLIGSPSAAAKEQDGDSSNAQDLLNLFFYRAEYDGYPADGGALDPAYFRAYCLITAFCVPDTSENGAGAGEKDLKLIGGVMQALHEEPRLDIADAGGAVVASLQVVPHQLTVDDLNHIWATQGELPYRLSIAYELALLPAPLAVAVDRQPRVGSLGLAVGPGGATEGSAVGDFRVERASVNTTDPAWSPALRLVGGDGKLRLATNFASADAPDSIQVVAAGVPNAPVSLVWDRWDREAGWRELGPAPEALPLSVATLDPDAPDVAPTAVRLPTKEPGQLQLTARRTWTRPDGSALVLLSNPVLVSIYGGGGT